MNYNQEKTAAQQMTNKMRSLIMDISKTNKAKDRKMLRDELDKKAKVVANLNALKKSYKDQTHTEKISEPDRLKRINAIEKLIEEINKLEKLAKDPTKINEALKK